MDRKVFYEVGSLSVVGESRSLHEIGCNALRNRVGGGGSSEGRQTEPEIKARGRRLSKALVLRILVQVLWLGRSGCGGFADCRSVRDYGVGGQRPCS